MNLLHFQYITSGKLQEEVDSKTKDRRSKTTNEEMNAINYIY